MLLVNSQHIKAVPGRKTDQQDSEWVADPLQHGLQRGSFVPPRPTRELRDLTRYPVSPTQEINRIANSMQKVREDANLKLASVATDHFDRINVNGIRCSPVRRLECLGYKVTLEPQAQTA